MNDFSPLAARLVSRAHGGAARAGHPFVDTSDLLVAYLVEAGSPWAIAFPTLQIDPSTVQAHLKAMVGEPEGRTQAAGPTPQLRELIEEAPGVARRLGHATVSAEALLSALLQQPGSLAALVLARHGVQADDVRQALARLGLPDAVAPASAPHHRSP